MADLKVKCMPQWTLEHKEILYVVNISNAIGPSHTTFTAMTLLPDRTNSST